MEAQQVDATAAYLENLDTVLRVASEKLEAIREDLASGDPERVARAMAAQRDLIELLVERIVVTTTGDRRPKDAKVSVTYRFRSAVVLSMNNGGRSRGRGSATI